MYQSFLYPARKSQLRNAIATVAWSEGNDASGIWSSRSIPVPAIAVSGLSITTICWMMRLITIHNTQA